LIWASSYGIVPSIIFGFAGRGKKLSNYIRNITSSNYQSDSENIDNSQNKSSSESTDIDNSNNSNASIIN